MLTKQNIFIFKNLLLRALGILSGFILSILIIKYFGVAAFGFFSILSIYSIIFTYFGKFGLDIAYVRSKIVYNQKIDDTYNYHSFYSLVVIICSIFIVAFISLTHLLKSYYTYFDYYYFEILTALLLSIPFALLYLNSEGLRSSGNSLAYIFFQGTSIPLLTLIITQILFFINLFDWRQTILVSFSLSVIISYLFSNLLYQKKLITSISVIKDYSKLLHFSFPFMINSIAVLLLGWTDSILLSFLRTEIEVGEYNFYLKISNLVFAPIPVIGAIYTKSILDKINSKSADLRNVMKNLTRSTFVISILVCLFIIVTYPYLIKIFSTNKPLAPNALYWLMSAQVLNAFTGPKDMLLQMIGNEKLLSAAFLIAIVINISLNLILIPTYGLLGSAIVNFISMMSWNFIVVVGLKAKTGINLVLK